MRSPTWCVHVVGPDDVLRAEDRHDAMRKAHDMNAAFLQTIDDFDEAGLFPPMWAVPSTWEALGIES